VISSLIPEWMITASSSTLVAGRPLSGESATWLLNGLGVNFYFGGTSTLIVVVFNGYVTQIEAQLIIAALPGLHRRAGAFGTSDFGKSEGRW